MEITIAAEFLKALGEPTRLRCAVLLVGHGETCVCHLAEALGEPDFKISRHLGVLKKLGLVNARREGTWMHYSLPPSSDPLICDLKRLLKNLLTSDPKLQADLKNLTTTQCSAPGDTP